MPDNIVALVFIQVLGGVVQDVTADRPGVKYLVLDYDNHPDTGVPEGEECAGSFNEAEVDPACFREKAT